MSDAMPSIADAIRRAIAESGTPLLSLAAATGVNRASLSRFVAGKRSLRLDMADRIASYFGLEVRRKRKVKAKGNKKGR
jgi:plasmid maintenance system antidote protein VapI